MEEGGGFLSGARLRGASGAVRVVCPVARERERERRRTRGGRGGGVTLFFRSFPETKLRAREVSQFINGSSQYLCSPCLLGDPQD